MIKSLKLDAGVFPLHDTDLADRVLRGMSQVNFFVGANNSGKSRFLRAFFAHRSREFELAGLDTDAVGQVVEGFSRNISDFFSQYHTVSYGPVNHNELIGMQFPRFLQLGYDFQKEILDKIALAAEVEDRFNSQSRAISGRQFGAALNRMGREALDALSGMVPGGIHDLKSRNVYIPVLRGLRPFDESLRPKDFYADRTVRDYFQGVEKKLDISKEMYTGTGLFHDCRKLLLGKKVDRDKIRAFEGFLSETFFSGSEVSIIPREDDHVVHIRIGEDEFPVYELGDGIQAVIILTYPMFFSAGEQVNFFIEEPEQFMHPGFQRVLLEALGREEFSGFQYFITTHSNHLLDLSMENSSVSVFTFRRNLESGSGFVIRNVKGDDVEILDLLGVRKSSVFLSNCTIWVEGITDRIYLRKYIDLFQKENRGRQFAEDIHYSFVEYGGNNITHWSFLDSGDPRHANIQVERICNRIFLIADSDGEKKGMEEEKSENRTKKAVRHLNLKSRLGEDYYRLGCREMENLLLPGVIGAVVAGWEGNAVDFSGFSEKKYGSEPLGAYIDSVVPGLLRSYGDKSGTVRNKVEFAKRAVTEIADFQEMSKEAKELAERLYAFIGRHNL